MKRLRNGILALVLGLALAEVVLHVAAAVSPRVRYLLSPPWTRVLLPDDSLGHRMSPLYPGNDSGGFRNARVPDACDVLTIGDSFTYGFGAGPAESWPRVLESLSRKQVYNMSCGAYSPLQYEVLFERGLRLRPSVVILGLTIVNDIAGSYMDVYGTRFGNRFDSLRTRDEAARADFEAAEGRSPLIGVNDVELNPGAPRPQEGAGPRAWLSRKSRLYALARELHAVTNANQEWPRVRGTRGLTYEMSCQRPARFGYDADARLRTVFYDPEGQTAHVDLDDPRIREGARITESLLLSMQSALRSRGTRFVVALFPSKRWVYRDLVQKTGSLLPPAFFSYAEKEARLSAALAEFLGDHGIEFVDTTPAMRACLERGVRPYPESDDGHPNAAGYRALAESLVPVVNHAGTAE